MKEYKMFWKNKSDAIKSITNSKEAKEKGVFLARNSRGKRYSLDKVKITAIKTQDGKWMPVASKLNKGGEK